VRDQELVILCLRVYFFPIRSSCNLCSATRGCYVDPRRPVAWLGSEAVTRSQFRCNSGITPFSVAPLDDRLPTQRPPHNRWQPGLTPLSMTLPLASVSTTAQTTVAQTATLPRELNYSCQANRKTRERGEHHYRDARFDPINATVKATITAGRGDSNGTKVRPWKRALRRFANQAGLKVCCEIDANFHPDCIEAANKEIQAINIAPDEFHREWNYTRCQNLEQYSVPLEDWADRSHPRRPARRHLFALTAQTSQKRDETQSKNRSMISNLQVRIFH
jgi:hypothetical protein